MLDEMNAALLTIGIRLSAGKSKIRPLQAEYKGEHDTQEGYNERARKGMYSTANMPSGSAGGRRARHTAASSSSFGGCKRTHRVAEKKISEKKLNSPFTLIKFLFFSFHPFLSNTVFCDSN